MVYCGNNRFELNGQQLGTNYQCFKKGIGVGNRLRRQRYEAIDPVDNIYCGNRVELPRYYDYIGTRVECLQKGVGVGRNLRRRGA
jgi:hypothetical protein